MSDDKPKEEEVEADFDLIIGRRVNALVSQAFEDVEEGRSAQKYANQLMSSALQKTSSSVSVSQSPRSEPTELPTQGASSSDKPPENMTNTEKIVFECVKTLVPEAALPFEEQFEAEASSNFGKAVVANALENAIHERMKIDGLVDISLSEVMAKGKDLLLGEKEKELFSREEKLSEKEKELVTREKEIDKKLASVDTQLAPQREELEKEREKLQKEIKQLDPWAGALHRWEVTLKQREEEIQIGEKKLKDRTEAVDREVRVKKAEVRLEFSRYEQEANTREDLSQQLKQMTTAFKSKDIFCTQQKEMYEKQFADIESKLFKTQDELRIMKMREGELMRYIASQNDRLQEVSLQSALSGQPPVQHYYKPANPYFDEVSIPPPSANSMQSGRHLASSSTLRRGTPMRLPAMSRHRDVPSRMSNMGSRISTRSVRPRDSSPYREQLDAGMRRTPSMDSRRMPITHLKEVQRTRHMTRTPNY